MFCLFYAITWFLTSPIHEYFINCLKCQNVLLHYFTREKCVKSIHGRGTTNTLLYTHFYLSRGFCYRKERAKSTDREKGAGGALEIGVYTVGIMYVLWLEPDSHFARKPAVCALFSSRTLHWLNVCNQIELFWVNGTHHFFMKLMYVPTIRLCTYFFQWRAFLMVYLKHFARYETTLNQLCATMIRNEDFR